MAYKRIFEVLAALGAGMAFAPGIGMAQQPERWQMGLQDAHSPIMERVQDFHSLLLIIIVAITAFVLGLLVVVMIRYRAKANPEPSKTTHNTLIEVIWTIIPIMILVVIGIPSFNLMYYQDRLPPDHEMTILARGHQWHWSYDYVDEAVNGGDGFQFTSHLVNRTVGDSYEELEQQRIEQFRERFGRAPVRLLDTNNPAVIPAGVTVRLLVTSNDVIHSWAIPSFGVKVDAVPGRMNEIWIRANEEGWYYGQCSELCGRDHGFMPIAIRAVSRAEYDRWVERSREWARNFENGYQLIQRPEPQANAEGATDE